MVDNTHVTPQTKVLKGSADSPGSYLIRLEADYGRAVESYIALGGPVDTADKIKDGGLARSIRADQASDLAGLDLEIVVVDSSQPPKIMTHIFDLKQWHAASDP
jgi:hypothetical protein